MMSAVRWFFLLVAILGLNALAQAGDIPDRFRDLKVYTFSEPDAKDPARIVVRMEFRNEGKKPLKMAATLSANEKTGFRGGQFARTIAASSQENWIFDLHPAANLRREILQGDIAFGGRKDRDLYLAIQGPDPADFKLKRVEKITGRAAAVATYLPRTQAAIEADFANWSKPAAKTASQLTLASNGASRYSIVLGSLPKNGPDGKPLTFEQVAALKDLKPDEQSLIAAAQDLQRCIQIKTGASLPIVTSTPSDPAHTVRIGDLNGVYQYDDYSIHTNAEGTVTINAATRAGLRNGIYGLLTDHLDCHWFLPNQLGEEIVVPADKTVTLPIDLAETKQPSFFSATGTSWGNSHPWDLRNRSILNAGRMVFGHSWDNFVHGDAKSYQEHPDWFARDRQGRIRNFDSAAGWSSTNFCSTNPEVIEIVAKKINAQFDADPDAIVMSIDPNDYAPMCLCDRCLALDKSYGETREDGRHVADRLLHFSRQIYDRLEPKYKDKFLGILIYGYQLDLPKGAKAHEHHAGMVCQFPRLFDHSRPFNDPTSKYARRFNELVKGWGSRLKQLGFYDYYGHYTFFGPWGIVHKMREDLPAFRDAGGTFVMIEAQPNFGGQGLNHYVAARLIWDLHADVDLLLEEYCRKFYGPAAEPMRKYWLAAERHFALERPAGGTADLVAARPRFWEELDENLTEAEKRVAGAAQRFRDRIQFNRDGFDLGRKMYLTEARYFPRGGEPDFDGAIAEVQKQQPWLDGLKKKYSGTESYWPTLMPTYFYPDVKELQTMRAAAIEAKKHPQPQQPSSLGDED